MIVIGSTSTDETSKLTYNFYTTYLVANKNIGNNVSYSSSGKYISINRYSFNARVTHLQHDIFGAGESFVVNEIRIFQQIHKVDNKSMSGEIVIETTNSDTGDVTYICIPLIDKGVSTSNDLDKLIQSVNANQLDQCPRKISLNTLIPKQDSCVYYDVTKGNTRTVFGANLTGKMNVVILKNPIIISKKTHDVLNGGNFATTKIDILTAASSGGGSGGSVTYKKLTNISGPESLGDDNIYIDCAGDSPGGGEPKVDTKNKFEEKDVKQIVILLILGFTFIMIMVMVDTFTLNKTTTMGLMIYRMTKSTFGMVVLYILLMIIFGLFITAVLKKSVNKMKLSIMLMIFLVCVLYLTRLDIANPKLNQYIVDYLYNKK